VYPCTATIAVATVSSDCLPVVYPCTTTATAAARESRERAPVPSLEAAIVGVGVGVGDAVAASLDIARCADLRESGKHTAAAVVVVAAAAVVIAGCGVGANVGKCRCARGLERRRMF
jgi:5,10-methylene-tetrahydrofolate dehydrogenase/methenyl tetrahydrofolate cyclohydrolase